MPMYGWPRCSCGDGRLGRPPERSEEANKDYVEARLMWSGRPLPLLLTLFLLLTLLHPAR
jgi:hypothetical protein